MVWGRCVGGTRDEYTRVTSSHSDHASLPLESSTVCAALLQQQGRPIGLLPGAIVVAPSGASLRSQCPPLLSWVALVRQACGGAAVRWGGAAVPLALAPSPALLVGAALTCAADWRARRERASAAPHHQPERKRTHRSDGPPTL